MNHCVRLFILFTPSLIGLGLLGIALSTNMWIISNEKYIPTEESLKTLSNNQRVYSALIPIPISRGLLSQCTAYRNVKVLISTDFNFRTQSNRGKTIKLSNETCTVNQFTCETGFAIVRPLTRCIDRRQKCDHIIDCEDKSDELSCPENPNNHNYEVSDCLKGYKRCPGEKICFRDDQQKCDGVVNCMNGSDEQNCDEEKCQRNKRVYCPREGVCARRENSKRCDGIIDCDDNSDEEYCPQCNGDSSTLSCDLKCFPREYRCDGIVDCSDLSDESGCQDYPTVPNYQRRIIDNNLHCMEQHLNPLNIAPPNDSSVELYPNPNERLEYLHRVYYLQLITIYGIAGGLVFLLLAVISLFFFGCCRRHCISVVFYFYGFWMLLAWLCILTALLSFGSLWFWQKYTVLDEEKNLSFEKMKHENNPNLKNIEFFGTSYWLACGAALSTFIGLLLSYCVCCTLGSSRADDKEYEIMQMHNY